MEPRKKRLLDALMNGYVSKLQQRFSHKCQKYRSTALYKAPKKVYGAAAQDTIISDYMATLNDDQVKLIQQVIGVCLCYGRAVAGSILPALSVITSEQSNGTK